MRLWDHYFRYIYVQTLFFYAKPVFLSLKITIMSFEEKNQGFNGNVKKNFFIACYVHKWFGEGTGKLPDPHKLTVMGEMNQ